MDWLIIVAGVLFLLRVRKSLPLPIFKERVTSETKKDVTYCRLWDREMKLRAGKTQDLKYYLAAAVSLLTFAIYLFSLRNDFVGYDDNTYVLNNPHIRSFDFNLFKWAFFDFYAANWHPLTWISHALDYAVWGLDPMGHHLTNNILHAANTFLVVLLVVRLMEAVKPVTAMPRPS